MKPSTFTKTVQVLTTCTATHRADFVLRHEEAALSQLRWFRAELTKVGMDAEKFAPYPHGSINREAYRMAESLYYSVRRYFQAANPNALRGIRDPLIVVERADAEAKVRADARKAANADFDAYLNKLANKIGQTITSAAISGGLWDGSTLAVGCEDGTNQVWNTKCIINQSVYHKLFNQWPTRRVS